MNHNDIEWLEDMVHAGRVSRYHNRPMITRQSTADHTWGVLVCCQWLTDRQCSAALLEAIIYHDVPEIYTGDMPAPIKNSVPELKDIMINLETNYMKEMGILPRITKEEVYILGIADTMELMMHCLKEMNMGNKYAMKIYNKGKEYLENKIHALQAHIRSTQEAGGELEYPSVSPKVNTFLSQISPF